MGEYLEEQNESIEEKKEAIEKKSILNISPKWFVVIGLFILILILLSSINLFKSTPLMIVVLGVVIVLILLAGSQQAEPLYEQHTTGEAIRIAEAELNNQLMDRSIGFPEGRFVPTGVVKPKIIEIKKEDVCTEILVAVDLYRKTGGEPLHYVARVHPYKDKVMGIEKRLIEFKGTEIEKVKYQVPESAEFNRKWFRGFGGQRR